MHRQPRDLIFKAAGEARVMTRPWHRSDEHPVTLATHPRRPRLQKAKARAEIQRPPPTPALALVIARAAPPATGTAIAVPVAGGAARAMTRARAGVGGGRWISARAFAFWRRG